MTGLDPREAPDHGDVLSATSNTYDRIATAYAGRAELTAPLRAHLEAFLQALPPGASVLDVGCGPGTHAALLAGRGLRPIGLDASAGMLELAARQVPVVIGDLRRLPVSDKSVDGIWSCASLLHVPRQDVPATLSSWYAGLRPGGVLGLSTALGGHDEQGWEVVPYDSTGPAAYAGPVRRWFVYHSRERLAALLAEAGFVVRSASTRTSHRTWWQVVATVPG